MIRTGKCTYLLMKKSLGTDAGKANISLVNTCCKVIKGRQATQNLAAHFYLLRFQDAAWET